MPKDVQVGKSKNNNWYEYQNSSLSWSDPDNSNYNNWFDAIIDGIDHSYQFYFIINDIEDFPGSSYHKKKVERIKQKMTEVMEKYGAELTDEVKCELYSTHGISVMEKYGTELTDEDKFELYSTHGIDISSATINDIREPIHLWGQCCNEMADKLINEAVVNFIKQIENEPVEEFRKLLNKLYPDDRSQTAFAEQFPWLANEFEVNPYPNRSDLGRIVECTGLSNDQICKWFSLQRKLNGLTRKPWREAHPELQSQFDINPYPSQDQSCKYNLWTLICCHEHY